MKHCHTEHMQIITTMQQKGGVGKTTTVANIAGALGLLGQRVLVVDLDPQANLTMSFGLTGEPSPHPQHPHGQQENPGIAQLFAAQFNNQQVSAKSLCIPAVNNVDVIRGSIKMAQVDAYLGQAAGSHQYLQNILATVDDLYDVCLIDCAPSLSPLTVSALGCADWVLVPMQPEYLPLSGLSQLTQTIQEARQVNPQLKLLGVVLTFVPRPLTNTAKEVIATLQENQVPLLQATISRTVRLAEGAKHGVPLVLTQPKNQAAMAYMALTGEIAQRLQLTIPQPAEEATVNG